MRVNKSKIHKGYTIWRLLKTEVQFSLTIGKIFGLVIGGLVMPILFSYIPIFINGMPGSTPGKEMIALALAFAAVNIFIFSRVITAVRDKSTVDKNKTAFLYYGKNKVTFAKLFVESIIFVIGYIMLFGILAIALVAKNTKAFDYSDLFTNMFKVLPGFLTLYLFIFSIAKWIISFIPKKGIAYGVAIFSTLIFIAPIMILNLIPITSTLNFSKDPGPRLPSFSTSWFSKNQLATSFIPIINFGLITGVGMNVDIGVDSYSQLDHDWYVIMPIMYSLLFTVGTWNLQSAAQKRYLAAS